MKTLRTLETSTKITSTKSRKLARADSCYALLYFLKELSWKYPEEVVFKVFQGELQDKLLKYYWNNLFLMHLTSFVHLITF